MKAHLSALVEQLYRALLLLYPAQYRHEYGTLMHQLFRDVSREIAQKQGISGLANWWRSALFDLFRTVIDQWRGTIMAEMMRVQSKAATLTAIILCLPLLFLWLTADLEAVRNLLTIDGYQPTIVGRIFMLISLLGLPIAFIVNLLSMFRKADAQPTPFKLTSIHAAIGLAALGIIFLTWNSGVFHELNQLIRAARANQVAVQFLFSLGLLALPVIFLFNVMPRFVLVNGIGSRCFQPTSINLIIGAAILLVILMFVSSLGMEMIACSSGIPNCD